MRKRRLPFTRLLAALIVVALGAVLLGCGGDETVVDEEQPTTVAPSATEPAPDTTPPESFADYPEEWTQGPATVEFSVEDDTCSSDECTIHYSTDGKKTWKSGTQVKIKKQGKQRVWVYAADAAGNEEEIGYCDLLIDNKAPTTKALNSPTVQKGKSVTLKYRIDDKTPRATATLRLTGPKNKDFDVGSQPTGKQRGKKITADLPAGTYTWSVYAKDQAGNKAKQRATGQLVVQPKPPTNGGGGGGELVGITESGECYHRLDCYHWTKDPPGNSKVTVAEAKAMGYRPCKVCSPPQ